MSATDQPGPTPRDEPTRTRSGSAFVLTAGAFLIGFLVLILVLSPRLQDNLGLNAGVQELPTPEEPVEVPLTLDGQEVGVAIWDGEGVCAEVTDAAGSTFRTCADPDPLRPIWAIDAPDEADPPYVILAVPPEVASVSGRTVDGEQIDALVEARELPAAWAIAPLAEGAVVDRIVAFNSDSSDLGDVLCGGEDSPGGGPARLGGGCVVPQQD